MKSRMLRVALVTSLSVVSCKSLQSVLPGDAAGITRMVDGVAKTYKKIEDARRDLTPDNELYLGRALSASIVERHAGLYHDKDAFRKKRLAGVSEYVANIGHVMVAAAADTRGSVEDDRPSPVAGWHFVVLRSDTVAAVSAPGGFVFVTDAAVLLAQTEDELAAVLAHEVAHVIRGHALRAIKQSRWTSLGAEFVTAAAGELGPKEIGQLADIMGDSITDMTTTLFSSGLSQDLEYEADAVAKQLLATAGYEPGALARFVARLPAQKGAAFFGTHPTPKERISKLGREGVGSNRARAMRFAGVKQRLARAVARAKASSRVGP